jgi:hypothetical protein
LNGRYSDNGWWYYFPIAFVSKTPLATLILLAWALLAAILSRLSKVRTGTGRLSLVDVSALMVPPLGFFSIALTSDINLGYRHLLPILPFLYTLIAVVLSSQTMPPFPHLFNKPGKGALTLLVIWMVVSTLAIHPHYLAYFNLLAGGPDNGWRILVDSNIDWGQDLGALRNWMDENDVEQVWLSYFGEARPDYYGIDYQGLDSYPPRLMNPEARPFYPHDPAPGTYAISVTNIQGVLFADHDEFAWFRERQPRAKIGYSIFIYDVPARGEPVDLLLSGVQLDQLEPADYLLMGTNRVVPHWFDAAQSFLLLPANVAFWASSPDTSQYAQSALKGISSYEPISERPAYSLRRSDVKAVAPLDGLIARFNSPDGQIALAGMSMEGDGIRAGQEFQFTSYWEQEAASQPVKIFIHAFAADDSLVTQWDGLGVVWEGWREGDILVQEHRLSVPSDLPAGDYYLWAGLYDPSSETRWRTDSGDRVYLGAFTVASSP